MIPDYQTLMNPVLESASAGEVKIRDVVAKLADTFGLTLEEREELLPSGKQQKFDNRVHWAKTYLKQAGLLEITRRGYFKITDRGKQALAEAAKVDTSYLEQFQEFKDFRSRAGQAVAAIAAANHPEERPSPSPTPDEALRQAYNELAGTVAAELVQRVQKSPPVLFERLVVKLLVAMGYGGSAGGPGQVLGKIGDEGVDGVIDQDPLGVDQVYVQAKRYSDSNNVGASAIRDFFGAIHQKKAQKGIFFTTSSFTEAAVSTARDLGARIVLIDGQKLGQLLFKYNVGCLDAEVIRLKKIDEDFFDLEDL